MDDISNSARLLDRVGSILEKYDTIARETGGSFNIFEIADISTKETAICRVNVGLACYATDFIIPKLGISIIIRRLTLNSINLNFIFLPY